MTRNTNSCCLEELVQSRLSELFGGFEVESSAAFRVTRDSDIEVIEQESDDMLRLVEERLRARRRADAVRLEIAADADDGADRTNRRAGAASRRSVARTGGLQRGLSHPRAGRSHRA